MEKPLMAEIIGELKPIHCEILVNIIREYGDRPRFHRGLLPFISKKEVVKLIAERIIYFNEYEYASSKKKIRYLKNILCKLDNISNCDMVFTILRLQDNALRRSFKWRISKQFYTYQNKKLIKLTWISKNKWKIEAETTSILEGATQRLAALYG